MASTTLCATRGVPPSFHERARSSGLKVLDTTCKFVYDIHRESKQALADDYHLIFIGDPKHREVIGYTNDLDPSSYHIVSTIEGANAVEWRRYAKLKVFYQTTLNADDFEDVVRAIEEGARQIDRADTICYATKENQDAARVLAHDSEIDLIIVIGGKKSANTNTSGRSAASRSGRTWCRAPPTSSRRARCSMARTTSSNSSALRVVW